jgi:hypothetical protein
MPDVFTSQETKDSAQEDTGTAMNMPAVQAEKIENEEQRRAMPHHTHNPLAAYSYYPDPDKLHFESKEDEEEIILFLRQHPIVNLKWIIISIFMILAPSVLTFFPLLSFMPPNFQVVAVLIWYLLTTAYVLENFLDWFFDIDIVTSERIVDFDFSNLTYKKVSDADLDKIQDVTYATGGVLRTLLNYGDVLVQTAAEVSEFDFLAVPSPDKVTKIINELKLKKERERDHSGI